MASRHPKGWLPDAEVSPLAPSLGTRSGMPTRWYFSCARDISTVTHNCYVIHQHQQEVGGCQQVSFTAEHPCSDPHHSGTQVVATVGLCCSDCSNHEPDVSVLPSSVTLQLIGGLRDARRAQTLIKSPFVCDLFRNRTEP